MNESQERIRKLANVVVGDVNALLTVSSIIEKGDGGITREKLEETLEKDSRELRDELVAVGEKFEFTCDTFQLLDAAGKFIRRRKLENGGEK